MLPGRNKTAQRRKALATMAGIVGALTLARAVSDPALSDEFLTAAIETFGT
jgi:TetR/AcrR family transcriptional repressor of nem operon